MKKIHVLLFHTLQCGKTFLRIKTYLYIALHCVGGMFVKAIG